MDTLRMRKYCKSGYPHLQILRPPSKLVIEGINAIGPLVLQTSRQQTEKHTEGNRISRGGPPTD